MSKDVTEVYRDEDMHVEIEPNSGILFIHVYVDSERFSKTVYKRMKSVFQELKRACFYYGWDEIFSYTQNHRLVEAFDGQIIDRIYHCGKEYEVVRWEL